MRSAAFFVTEKSASMNHSLLLPGWRLSHPTPEDLPAVTDLIAACDSADYGHADTTIEDMQADWRRAGFDPDQHAWLLWTPQGQLAGYTDYWLKDDELYISPNTAIHPGMREQVDELLFYRLAEEYASQQTPRPDWLRTASLLDRRSRMLENVGYQLTRVDWLMEVDLPEPPPPPTWPAGFRLRPFVMERDARSVHTLIQTAFRDLPNRREFSFDEWSKWIVQRADFDPSLCLTAVDPTGSICGTALCFDYPTGGWVRQLAVRKDCRGLGLGLAIIQHAFGEFYRRGKRSAGLVVDSQNPTGAPHLYLKVGMHPALKIITYKKTLDQ
jgi:ribosomal protein S18 acetylase RimI-like enzyme